MYVPWKRRERTEEIFEIIIGFPQICDRHETTDPGSPENTEQGNTENPTPRRSVFSQREVRRNPESSQRKALGEKGSGVPKRLRHNYDAHVMWVKGHSTAWCRHADAQQPRFTTGQGRAGPTQARTVGGQSFTGVTGGGSDD